MDFEAEQRWERDDSPGPILMASQLIRIQSEVVDDENVSSPSSAAARTNIDPG